MDYEQLKALIEQRGVHTVFGEPGEGWFIEQNPHELAVFLVEMQKLGVTSVLEIGTGWRAGLARFLHDDMGWEVVSVDIHDYGHHFDGITFTTLDQIAEIVDRRFDLLILDGDHSYEGTKHGHTWWGGLAEMGSKVIAFHDTCGLRDCEGVAKYWNEIAHSGKPLKPGYYEIIADGDQRGGIGYIVLAEVENYSRFLSQQKVDVATDDSEGKPSGTHEVLPKPPTKPRTPRKPAAKKATPAKKAPVKK